MSQIELASVSGISRAAIQNYELGLKTPKSRSTYTKLANALGVDENALLDSDASFVLQAKEQYSNRGAQQAWDLVSDLKAMWAGGEVDEEDMNEIMRAMQEAYWEAKKNNRKYAGKSSQEKE